MNDNPTMWILIDTDTDKQIAEIKAGDMSLFAVLGSSGYEYYEKSEFERLGLEECREKYDFYPNPYGN